MFEQYSNEIIIIKLNKFMESDLQAAARLIKTWLLNPALFHILDFSGVEKIDDGYKVLIANYAETLKRYKKTFGSINLSITYKANLSPQELAIYNVKSDLEEIAGNKARRGTLPKKKPLFKLDANYLNLFISKIVYVFQEQIGLPLRNLEPYLKGTKPSGFEPEILAIVDVNSEYITGSLSLSFPENTYVKVYNKLTGETSEKINDQNKDGVAELLNMIYGCVKQALNQNENMLNMQIPKVLTGEQLKLSNKKIERVIVVTFQSQFGYFNFEVILEGNKNG